MPLHHTRSKGESHSRSRRLKSYLDGEKGARRKARDSVGSRVDVERWQRVGGCNRHQRAHRNKSGSGGEYHGVGILGCQGRDDAAEGDERRSG